MKTYCRKRQVILETRFKASSTINESMQNNKNYLTELLLYLDIPLFNSNICFLK